MFILHFVNQANANPSKQKASIYLLPVGDNVGTLVQGVADTMVEVRGEMDSEADTVSGLSCPLEARTEGLPYLLPRGREM